MHLSGDNVFDHSTTKKGHRLNTKIRPGSAVPHHMEVVQRGKNEVLAEKSNSATDCKLRVF
jgi:hypothetical protein